MVSSWWIRFVIWNESEDLKLCSDIEEGRIFIGRRFMRTTLPYVRTLCDKTHCGSHCPLPVSYLPIPGVTSPPPPNIPGIVSSLHNSLFKFNVSFVLITLWSVLSLQFFSNIPVQTFHCQSDWYVRQKTPLDLDWNRYWIEQRYLKKFNFIF